MERKTIDLRKIPQISLGKVIRCKTYVHDEGKAELVGPWMITDIFPHFVKVRHIKKDIETTIDTGDLVMGGIVCGR